jgi:hypothetical protein
MPELRWLGERFLFRLNSDSESALITICCSQLWREECKRLSADISKHDRAVKTLWVTDLPHRELLEGFVGISLGKATSAIFLQADTIVLGIDACHDLSQIGLYATMYLRSLVTPKHLCVDMSRNIISDSMSTSDTLPNSRPDLNGIIQKLRLYVKDWPLESITWHGVEVLPSKRYTGARHRYFLAPQAKSVLSCSNDSIDKSVILSGFIPLEAGIGESQISNDEVLLDIHQYRNFLDSYPEETTFVRAEDFPHGITPLLARRAVQYRIKCVTAARMCWCCEKA